MDVLEILSRRLKELRIENNYSQYEIADLMGIAQVTYSHYELGRPQQKFRHNYYMPYYSKIQ